MKKVSVLFLAFIMAAALASCSSTQYDETVVTEIVTDENGETVTDENGDAVTEIVTEADDNANESTAQSESGDKADGDSNKTSASEKTTASGSDTIVKQTTAKATTTKVTTTEKPKNREVSVDIIMPYYNGQETEVTVSYKLDGDKKYTSLDPVKTKLNKAGNVMNFELGKLKGNVTVIVNFSGIDLTDNKIVISAQDSKGKITPVTGIEILQGEND